MLGSAGVILDSDLVPEGVSPAFAKMPNEEQSDYLARVTHLHHQGHNIRQIGDLTSVRNLTVLYLYDNRIERIERLESVPHLRMLYLQRNRISRIENLGHLTRLRKLYLSANRIQVVENLDKLTSLVELHVDHQQLKEDTCVVLDPRSCQGLRSLHTLDASGNAMVAAAPVNLCKALRVLNLADNAFQSHDTSDVLSVVGSLPCLTWLDLRGCPAAQSPVHWRHVVAACADSLAALDGRTVTQEARRCIKAMAGRSAAAAAAASASASAAASVRRPPRNE